MNTDMQVKWIRRQPLNTQNMGECSAEPGREYCAISPDYRCGDVLVSRREVILFGVIVEVTINVVPVLPVGG